jgi:hypothetical protein
VDSSTRSQKIWTLLITDCTSAINKFTLVQFVNLNYPFGSAQLLQEGCPASGISQLSSYLLPDSLGGLSEGVEGQTDRFQLVSKHSEASGSLHVTSLLLFGQCAWPSWPLLALLSFLPDISSWPNLQPDLSLVKAPLTEFAMTFVGLSHLVPVT